MIRNLKALGLALVAVFALSAVAASAASAQQGKLTSDGPVTLVATETGGVASNAFTSFGGRIECPGSTITGHALKVTPHGLIPNGVTGVTLTPHFKQTACRGFSGGSEFTVTVTMTSCDFELTIGTTTQTANTYGATAHVECLTPGDAIHVEFWTSGTAHTNAPICQLTITQQTNLTGPHITSTGTDVDVHGTFNNIHVHRSGLCTLDGKGTTTTVGQFHIDATVKGQTAAGGATNISVTD